jgi:hypothetical protein
MRNPPFRCLFCQSTSAPFERVEHPIPESLGNDDLVLPGGFVCDPCNQYFGAKVERFALSSPPFGIERVAASIPSKRGKLPSFTEDPRISFYASGFLDTVLFAATPSYWLDPSGNPLKRYVAPVETEDRLSILRLMLKMGLELLLTLAPELDPYSPQFDAARRFARFAKPGSSWDLGYALWPDRSSLHLSERTDEVGPLITHQLYEYSLGRLASQHIAFYFAYRTHLFSCNLSAPSLIEYQSGFNAQNHVQVQRWTITV